LNDGSNPLCALPRSVRRGGAPSPDRRFAVEQNRAVGAHALILGCGRSGTSIFGELFESLPGFTYASEPFLADLPGLAAGEHLAVKVPRQRPDDHPPAGLPAAPAELHRAMPQPLVVFWQVRHPLDTVCSLRVGISQGWGHHPRPPDWQEWLHRPLVEQCAHHWAVINQAGYDLVRDVAVVNRFEDMIRDPRTCAETAVQAVGIDPSTVAGELRTWSERVQDTNNDRFVEAMTSRRHSRPDHDRRVERWRDNLTPAEVASIVPVVGDAARRFGYDLPAGWT
jgi:hypothetical protein